MAANIHRCSANPLTARLGILFSGGIDSIVLVALANKFVPPGQPIDLLNVAFAHADSFDVPDRKTGSSGLAELRYLLWFTHH